MSCCPPCLLFFLALVSPWLFFFVSRSLRSRPARGSGVPVVGSPPSTGPGRVSHAAARRKSLAQQIEGQSSLASVVCLIFCPGEENSNRVSALPAISPRSPHLQRVSRSPKTKSTQLPSTKDRSESRGDFLDGDVPKICTEDLARMLHGGADEGPRSPTSPAAHVPVAGLSEQLKEKAAVVALPLSGSPRSGSPRHPK